MRLLFTRKTIGLTLKFVIEADEDLIELLLNTLPSDITINGEHLWNVRIGIRGGELEPVRVAICRENLSIDQEDPYLENN